MRDGRQRVGRGAALHGGENLQLAHGGAAMRRLAGGRPLQKVLLLLQLQLLLLLLLQLLLLLWQTLCMAAVLQPGRIARMLGPQMLGPHVQACTEEGHIRPVAN